MPEVTLLPAPTLKCEASIPAARSFSVRIPVAVWQMLVSFERSRHMFFCFFNESSNELNCLINDTGLPVKVPVAPLSSPLAPPLHPSGLNGNHPKLMQPTAASASNLMLRSTATVQPSALHPPLPQSSPHHHRNAPGTSFHPFLANLFCFGFFLDRNFRQRRENQIENYISDDRWR